MLSLNIVFTILFCLSKKVFQKRTSCRTLPPALKKARKSQKSGPDANGQETPAAPFLIF